MKCVATVVGGMMVAGQAVSGSMEVSTPLIHSGMCDASAAVALTSDLFAVANDEDSVIRLYRTDKPGPPVSAFNLASFLELGRKSPETDLEGAARIGNRIYWISSHGRNQDGKEQPNRQRFFATDVTTNATGVQLKPVGKACRRLLQDLINEPKLKPFKLDAAARRAPRANGALNIEGLAATPQGHLLIGFRNPIPGGKALLVPLLNPEELIQGKPGRFGEPILLDLDGLGVRDIAHFGDRYLIVAGAFDGKGKHWIYEWKGDSTRPRLCDEIRLWHLNPEALVFYPDRGQEQFQILSDDGSKSVGGKKCKDIKDASKRSFRSVWIKP